MADTSASAPPHNPAAPAAPAAAPASQGRRPVASKRRFLGIPGLAGLVGVTSVGLLALNTILCFVFIMPLALLKLALPAQAVRRRVDPWLNAIATYWVACNSRWITLLQPKVWDMEVDPGLRLTDWYLVNCNHQSWVDIFVLQLALNRRIPMLKFFLKQNLLYVPVIGLAWWALDFPFLKRYSKAKLRRNPALARRDADTARRACEKFALVPTSVMVFAEGTRYTDEKRQAQSSPYQHLLKPKAGALATTLNAMGSRFQSMVDATIVYPDGVPSFWQLASGRAGRIVVRIRQMPIPESFSTGNYATDKPFRTAFHKWLADLWQTKDREIDAIHHGDNAAD